MSRQYTYWISTALLCLLYLASASLYITQGDAVRQALGALGFPAYLVPVMIATKLLAVAAIVSRIKVALSDLAYAGMLYHLLLSASAHVNAGSPIGAVPALAGLVLLAASFLTQNAARESQSPYAPAAA
jgi:hypothetical protein